MYFVLEAFDIVCEEGVEHLAREALKHLPSQCF